MVAFLNATSKTHDNDDIIVMVNPDFNDFFKDKNQLKVTIYLGNSYIVIGAESWFELTSKVAAKWGDEMAKSGKFMHQDDPCIPASIE